MPDCTCIVDFDTALIRPSCPVHGTGKECTCSKVERPNDDIFDQDIDPYCPAHGNDAMDKQHAEIGAKVPPRSQESQDESLDNEHAKSLLKSCLEQGYTLHIEDLGVEADTEKKTVKLSPHPDHASTVANKVKKSVELHRWDGRDREVRRLIAKVDAGLTIDRDYLKGRHRSILRQKERIKLKGKTQ